MEIATGSESARSSASVAMRSRMPGQPPDACHSSLHTEVEDELGHLASSGFELAVQVVGGFFPGKRMNMEIGDHAIGQRLQTGRLQQRL